MGLNADHQAERVHLGSRKVGPGVQHPGNKTGKNYETYQTKSTKKHATIRQTTQGAHGHKHTVRVEVIGHIRVRQVTGHRWNAGRNRSFVIKQETLQMTQLETLHQKLRSEH